MAKQSAGLLVYRRRLGRIEVFLVHPGGPFWAKKNEGAWSIPKGEFAAPETPLDAALREFREETGQTIVGDYVALKPSRQAGGKTIHAFAVEGSVDANAIVSNVFEMEWPPHSDQRQSFPEIDRGAWFDIDNARKALLVGQRPLLDELVERLTPPK